MDFQTKRFDSDIEGNSAFELSWIRKLLADEDVDKETVYNIMFVLDKSGSMGDDIGYGNGNGNQIMLMNSVNSLLPPRPVLTRTSSIMPNLILPPPIIPMSQKSPMFNPLPNRTRRSYVQSPLSPIFVSDNRFSYGSSNEHSISKNQLVSHTVGKCLYLVSELNRTGMNIQVSIVMFDSNARLAYPFKKVDETEYNMIKSKLDDWCMPGGGTEMNKAFRIVASTIEEEKQKSPNSKFHTILLSDGYNNDNKDDELIANYGSLITSAIGLGEIDDYNHKLFCDLASKDRTYCASNESKLRDYFLQNVFGTTTKVASGLKIRISSNSIVTPHDFKKEDNNSVIELDTFHSHRKIYFLAPTETNITICYTNNSNKQEKCIIFTPLKI